MTWKKSLSHQICLRDYHSCLFSYSFPCAGLSNSGGPWQFNTRQMTSILHCQPPPPHPPAVPLLIHPFKISWRVGVKRGTQRLRMKLPHTRRVNASSSLKGDKLGGHRACRKTSIHKKMTDKDGHFCASGANRQVRCNSVLLFFLRKTDLLKNRIQLMMMCLRNCMDLKSSSVLLSKCFPIAPVHCVWSSQTTSTGDAQEAGNSYWGANFPWDSK